MPNDITDIVRELAARAEDVCRHYLPAGKREGRCWRVGDVRNSPGRSAYVRLECVAAGGAAAGKWVDCASGEHGDLLDLIREARGFASLRDTLDEARWFLGRPMRNVPNGSTNDGGACLDYDPQRSVQRLLSESTPIGGTLAESYLRKRGIDALDDVAPLRFHPACPCRDGKTGRFVSLPALLAIVTDSFGNIKGLQRTYLARDGCGKATIVAPRRSIGSLLTHAVRFGALRNVAVAGEGVETLLALKSALPTMPILAALSATNLAALAWPTGLQRLYIAVDRDCAGAKAAETLFAHALSKCAAAIPLTPVGKDFNDDLISVGLAAMLANLRPQLLAGDVDRLLSQQLPNAAKTLAKA